MLNTLTDKMTHMYVDCVWPEAQLWVLQYSNQSRESPVTVLKWRREKSVNKMLFVPRRWTIEHCRWNRETFINYDLRLSVFLNYLLFSCRKCRRYALQLLRVSSSFEKIKRAALPLPPNTKETLKLIGKYSFEYSAVPCCSFAVFTGLSTHQNSNFTLS